MTYLILKYEGHTASYNTLQANDQTETHKHASWCSTCFCVILCVGFCTGHLRCP